MYKTKNFITQLHNRDKECSIKFDEKNCTVTDNYKSIARCVEDCANKTIIQAFINYARENNLDDVYLIDEEFVKSAIEHEIEYRNFLSDLDNLCIKEGRSKAYDIKCFKE